MNEHVKDLIAGAIGFALLISTVLTGILLFLYVRDGMSTPVPMLLLGSIIFFIITIFLTWRYQRVREWLLVDFLSWFVPPW